MNTKQAIKLILSAIQKYSGGEIFVLNMPGTTVEIIAKSMIELFGNKKTKIKIIGPRQGEKKHEVLISKNESPFTEDTNDSYYTIHPNFKPVEIKKPFDLEEFTSQNTTQLTQKQLVEVLKKEKWLFLD